MYLCTTKNYTDLFVDLRVKAFQWSIPRELEIFLPIMVSCLFSFGSASLRWRAPNFFLGGFVSYYDVAESVSKERTNMEGKEQSIAWSNLG